ncbi:uncharacterized protein LOC129613045 [Condylostylus longicornis]|uniref:uncharacterized protein LOC129613045 n=1 Tax=Condylostylus longicornis TaxID=2530218 RepID=UPI00244DF01A|nr:uncharacterized protein LOC129613045 [Condylostylus longicornis]
MFDENIDFDCDECGGAGPPPKFMIPPPPRPPFMQELSKCREDDDEINSSNYISSSSSSSKSDNNNIFYSNSDINWDNSDICEAIPILDASYHSSPSLQTSAMIAVFSLLLVLVVLISSLFVWK